MLQFKDAYSCKKFHFNNTKTSNRLDRAIGIKMEQEDGKIKDITLLNNEPKMSIFIFMDGCGV